MGDPTPYAEERLRLWGRLRSSAPHGSLTELFRPAAGDLRFRLGTSLADLRIPFKIASGLRHFFSHGTIQAYLLAGQRHKANIPPDAYDQLVTMEGFDPTQLRPLSFALPSAVVSQGVRRAFFDAMDDHVGVDAGLIASFLGTDRPGRQLCTAVHSVLAKAREESQRTGEPTLYITALMLRSAAESSYALTRDAPVSEPMARFLRTAGATLLAAAVHLAVREAGLQDSVDPQALLAASTLGLLPFLGSRPGVAGSGLTAWGVAFNQTSPWLEDTLARLTRGDEPESAVRDLAASFPSDRELQRRAERLGGFAFLRESCRELARLLDGTTSVTFSIPQEGRLARILGTRDGLERIFASESKRKEVVKAAREALKSTQAQAMRERLELVAHAAQEYRDDEPAAWRGAADARLRTARSVVALAADLLIERQVAAAAQLLLERSGGETEGGEAAEYESGRLYYVSHELTPLLRDRAPIPQVGHLFCDMKDFTRRTAFLKESVIADFLQREFYTPILSAASGVDPGSHKPVVHSDISLNNLVGDAVSFSGDVVALMNLAQSVYGSIRDYGRRLDAEGSQQAVASRVAELEQQHLSRRASMERSVRELTARVQGADGATRDQLTLRIQEVRADLARQTALFHADLTRASGEKLEAGIFISHGAAPEIAKFEDPWFGPLRVAIAEKINESARGTARNGAVRDKVEILRRRASEAIGHDLELPFSVLVESPAAISIGTEEAMLIAELIERKELASAQQRLMQAAQRAVDHPPSVGDIYNHGIGCSEDAVAAYIDARGDEIRVVRKDIPVASLHSQISGRYFFPRDPVHLVACINPSSRSLVQLFVLQGRAVFRGFEAMGGLGVYEVLPLRSPLYELLARHHLPQWSKG